MTTKEYLGQINTVIENGKYKDDWASLSGHKTPSWYYKGKLGIFIHWGIYSVPAFGNEWYSRNMYDKDTREYEHHLTHYGKQSEFGYKDFIPMFKGERFDAEKWVSLFKEAGAKFVMPVCEHHDGFAMYSTEFNRWNAKDMGPRRDVAGEIKAECERQGLTFCASTHRAEHYFFMNPGRTIESDVNDEAYSDFYGLAVDDPDYMGQKMFETTFDVYSVGASKEWLDDWMVRTCELIDKLQPGILYFDWWIHNQSFKPYLKKICAYYYNRADEWGKEVTINYKYDAFAPTVANFDVERGGLKDISPLPWQTDTAIGKDSWGYTTDNRFKGARQIITDLIDTVSKNGMLLLNIGPKADGTITEKETAVLKELGAWLKINGEGIYETTPWKHFGEGETNGKDGFFNDGDEKQFTSGDFRFTYKNGCVYAFQMRPDANDVKIKSFRKKDCDWYSPIKSVTLLSTGENVSWIRDENALSINADRSFGSDLPLCFKIELG